MNLKELYHRIEQRIQSVDFDALWKGFKPLKFALYNSEECFFHGEYIPKSGDFFANTAILYEGEYIAIWNIQGDMDEDILASKMIHEMFHAFQKQNGESRFPDEMATPLEYRYSVEALTIKAAEDQLLAELSEQFSPELWQKLLRYRKYRRSRYPYEYNYEAAVEQIEGSATYVELAALKQLSPAKYADRLSALREKLRQPENLFPVRILSYDIGALIFLLCWEQGLADFQDFSPVPFTCSLLETVMEEEGLPSDPAVEQQIDRFFAIIRREIDGALREGQLLLEKDCRLLSVNIYDARYCEPYLLSRNFVLYEDEQGEQFASGDFVIEMAGKDRIKRIWQSSFKD